MKGLGALAGTVGKSAVSQSPGQRLGRSVSDHAGVLVTTAAAGAALVALSAVSAATSALRRRTEKS